MHPIITTHHPDVIYDQVQADGTWCEECEYSHCWPERHPYGDTFATERLCECLLFERKHARFADCPGVMAVLEAIVKAAKEELK